MKSSAIAIVGMAGRFPGARNVEEFWRNLRNGVESIRDLTDEELLQAGATPEEVSLANYVKRAAILDDVALFDASFFGFSPRDAAIMDPQHRHFLECAWEALEDAACPPQRFPGSIGVFAGSGLNSYLIHNLLANRRLVESAGLFQLKQTGNDKDVLATRVSYQLDLRGPSINVQTACSTSLVAVHLACQSLLNFECDMALAGGVTIEVPHGLGYLYREGEILSRDGHCRAFDVSSSGTVFASGLGIVVLRRLEDAIQDRDHIRAVILGSAINNDGGRKVGYLAPSVDGQAEVIAEALDFSGVSADDIDYVEAHGTGTKVGDPIEVRALTQAFRRTTQRSRFCALGSLKSNLGHLDAAAGVGGLMKAALALEHAEIPPTLHFKSINPHIELDASPFLIASQLTPWDRKDKPRRAGVTALGIGGTNAHLVLEEAPERRLQRTSKPYELVMTSGKSQVAADQAWTRLSAHIHEHPDLHLADIAWTCQIGRQAFSHRRACVVEAGSEGYAVTPGPVSKAPISGTANRTSPAVAFLFPGQGSQYVEMGLDHDRHEPVFRNALRRCAEVLRPYLGIDLVDVIYPAENQREAAAQRLQETWLTQPALFAVEYAAACWWKNLGIQPSAMVGHSIGEYVAASLAGVFSLEDALRLVALRGRMIFDLPPGAMLAIQLPASEVELAGTVTVAAINNPNTCVVSGPSDEIAAFESEMTARGVECRRLLTSHAFHSAMMDPVLAPFEAEVRRTALKSPAIPYLSNVTGSWIKSEEATDPAYWARHIRSTVRFSDCLAELLKTPDQLLIEAGPGNVLTSHARQMGGAGAKAFQTLPHPREKMSSLRCALHTAGQIWAIGATLDWRAMHAPDSVQRVPLPTYPFEHQKFWIEPDPRFESPAPASERPAQKEGSLWTYQSSWKLAPPTAAESSQRGSWVIFRDSLKISDEVAKQLTAAGHRVATVDIGKGFRSTKQAHFTMAPGSREDSVRLVDHLVDAGFENCRILYLWSILLESDRVTTEELLDRSFFTPLFLAQAFANRDIPDLEILLVSNRLQQVGGEAIHHPERAVLMGPARVVTREIPSITCRAIDLGHEDRDAAQAARLLIAEALVEDKRNAVYRNGERFAEALEPFNLATRTERRKLRHNGVYLITGGFGALGLALAEHLARTFAARLILVGRAGVVAETQWQESLDDPALFEQEKDRIRRLISIRKAAGGLLLETADVLNPTEMRRVVAEAKTRFGKIDGVFHAAGVLDDGPLMLKSKESALRVLDPKVRGTLVLEDALRTEDLDCLVLFSSISAILPPAGQIDYAAANAFLDAFAASRRGVVTAINWGAWIDGGMGARSVSPHPWLERRLLDTPQAIVFASEMSRAKNWVVAEHAFKSGRCLVPGTGYLELVTGAFARGSIELPVELQDVYFLAPLTFDKDQSREVRVQLKRSEVGLASQVSFDFSVVASGEAWREHCTGRIAVGRPPEHLRADIQAIAARCGRRQITFDEQHRTEQERYFTFGARWRSLKSIGIGDGEGWAELELDPAFAAETSTLHLHPALMDMVTGCALYLTEQYQGSNELYFPVSYKKIRLFRPLPPRVFSHIRPHSDNIVHGEFERFDITVYDQTGETVADIEGFAMRRIEEASKAVWDSNWVQSGDTRRAAELFDATPIIGIRAADGVEILTRILQCDAPVNLVVTAQPVEIEKANSSPATAASTREPAADSSVEDTIAGWFEELLGVEKVGPDDDFFSLGGHSLVGIRLFAKMKNRFKVDLELATLFQARTVRQLAELVPNSATPVTTALAASRTEPSKWSYLVPIQPSGNRVPMFFVHAVGGEVLFYQPLASALGNDQPVYAFRPYLSVHQGGPAVTLTEMAAAYVKEMRAMLPNGPYLIGGLSYGGLVAVEMARELVAQGVEPTLVAVMDASVPGSSKRLGVRDQVSALFDNLRRDGSMYLLRKARLKRKYLTRKIVHQAQLLMASRHNHKNGKAPANLRYAQIEDAHVRAIAHHEFKPYSGSIMLLRAANRGYEGVTSLSEIEDPTLGWGKLILGKLDICDVPANHLNMLLEPNVHEVARLLAQAALRHSQQATPLK